MIRVRATAINSYGPALLASPINTFGAQIRQVPAQMNMPTLVFGTDYSVEVQWIPLTNSATGDSPILSYNLYWDNGSGATTIELCDTLVTQFTVTELQGGVNYLFKVRATNIYGYGAFSDEFSITAATQPGKPL